MNGDATALTMLKAKSVPFSKDGPLVPLAADLTTSQTLGAPVQLKGASSVSLPRGGAYLHSLQFSTF